MKVVLINRKPSYKALTNSVEWSGDKLNLKNDGTLEICFIGVGSAFAKTMYQNNMIIIKGDTHILVDFGATGPTALNVTCGLDMNDIECILPTHSHSDHVGGIEALGQINKYVGIPFMKKPKLKMIITEEYQRILWENTLRGGLEYNEEIVNGTKMQFKDYYDAVRPKWKSHQPREIFEIDFNLHDTGKPEDTVHLEIFRTVHIPEQSQSWEAAFVSYGLLIDGVVFYSSDTKWDPYLINLYIVRAKWWFHDVQFFPGAVHSPLNYMQIELPSKIRSKMYLMHIADNWKEQDISGFAGFAKQGCRYIFDDI